MADFKASDELISPASMPTKRRHIRPWSAAFDRRCWSDGPYTRTAGGGTTLPALDGAQCTASMPALSGAGGPWGSQYLTEAFFGAFAAEPTGARIWWLFSASRAVDPSIRCDVALRVQP